MKVQGAIIKEQGVTFSIVIVKQDALNDTAKGDAVRAGLSNVLPSPIILMAQNARGTPTYQGRSDIVRFLAKIDMRRIPWKEYTIS